MSSLPVKPPTSRDIPALYVVVAAVLFAAALAASLGAKPSVRITVDGVPRRVEAGTSVADLRKMGYLTARSGRVRAISGRLLERPNGNQPSLRRNGRPTVGEQLVYDGDVIASASGRDETEAVVVRQERVPAPVETVGSGPLITVTSPGSSGLKQVTMGAISAEVVTSTILSPATPMVVTRYNKRAHHKLVALTFDDGPWPGQTDQILRILRQNKVKATFFMLGYLAKKNSSLARRVAADGNLIGNHTMGHRKLTELSPAAVDQQIATAETAILYSTGEIAEWFRPPGGYISPAVWARARKASLKVALWNVDPQDWRRPPAAELYRDVISHVRPGSIVLLHDGGGDRTQTIAALPLIIRSLKSRGYRFVTLDEMPR